MDQSPARPPHTAASSRARTLRIYGICFAAGLLLGLLPIGLRLIQTQRERDVLQQQLLLANLEINLSSAAVLARHGDYTAARDAASRFFTEAREAVDRRDEALTPAQVQYLQSALAERDALITLLARGDPAGAERSTTMYVAHRAAFPR